MSEESEVVLTDAERRERLWKLGPMFTEGPPHSAELGIKFVAIDLNQATLCLPYNAKLIGDAERRVMFGGAVTTLLDQASGLAATAGLLDIKPVATLDLRIDYMRAAEPGKDIIAEAHCYKTTRDIAFVRAVAHDGDSDDPVAMSQATFMTIRSGTASKLPPKADKEAKS